VRFHPADEQRHLRGFATRRGVRAAALSAGLALALSSPPVKAAEEIASAPASNVQSQPNPAASPAAARGPDDRRQPPDYSGRPEPTSVGEVALWVPRVVLFPLYLVSEYLVRRPLGWLASTAEREHWPTLVLDFLTFGEDRQGGIVPTGMIDYGMRPSIGVYAFWDDFIARGNDLRFRAAYGGSRLYQLRLSDRLALGTGKLSLTGVYDSRPDNVFHGIGDNGIERRSRYFLSTARAVVAYAFPWVRSSHARVSGGLREVSLDGDGHCCEDPSVNEQVRAGVFEAPPGMDQVFDVLDQNAELVLDSRWPRAPEHLELASDYVTPPGTGVRLALRGGASELTGQTLAPRTALADAWVHYGASLGGYLDVTGEQRAVSATVIVDFADPLGQGDVPLTDLISLGGERPLRGFLANQFVNRSAAALRLEYRWPVAVWLDGSLQYEAGNVFGKGLSGFELASLRSSFGLGLAMLGSQDHTFQALVAFGTEPYDAGARIDSFRFALGTTAGF
jgi:hypothetical protein